MHPSVSPDVPRVSVLEQLAQPKGAIPQVCWYKRPCKQYSSLTFFPTSRMICCQRLQAS
jgi:hypothetical protein